MHSSLAKMLQEGKPGWVGWDSLSMQQHRHLWQRTACSRGESWSPPPTIPQRAPAPTDTHLQGGQPQQGAAHSTLAPTMPENAPVGAGSSPAAGSCGVGGRDGAASRCPCACACPCVCETSSRSGCARSCPGAHPKQTPMGANEPHANHWNQGAKKAPAVGMPSQAAVPVRGCQRAQKTRPAAACFPSSKRRHSAQHSTRHTKPRHGTPAQHPAHSTAPSIPTRCPRAGLPGATRLQCHATSIPWAGRAGSHGERLLRSQPVPWPHPHVTMSPVPAPDGGVTASPPTLQTPDFSLGLMHQPPAS